MITINLLKYLEDNGFGKIDESLFWQKLALGRNGVYIADLGATSERGEQRATRFELYSRGASDVQGFKQLEKIVRFLNGSFNVCTLPAVEGITEEAKNVTIMPLSTIASSGLDENGRTIFTATGLIYHN